MKLTFRIDDVTERMDWESFDKFMSLMEEFRLKPLLGVVPFCRDTQLNQWELREDFWPYIVRLQKEGFCIAQHGDNHIYLEGTRESLFPANTYSAYSGLSYEDQYEKLKKGKEALEACGIVTDIFMAPAHSYDRNTLKALKNLGFHHMTDGCQKTPYELEGLIFHPIALSIRRIQYYVRKYASVTVVVHTNQISERTMGQYRGICERYLEHLCSYGEILAIPAKAYDRTQEEREFRARQRLEMLRRIVKGKR